MKREHIIRVVERYISRLREAQIPKSRMNPARTFGSLTQEEVLAHAHYLCARIKSSDPAEKHEAKTMRHLAAAQMCLSFANWYTLEELMDHNRELY